jgi:hypothetical protein
MVDTPNEDPIKDLFDFPLLEAMFGRRARRFGMGMEIPSGPLAFKSSAEPAPLTELEHAVLVAAGTGVTGWNFGVPFGPDRPNSHAHYTQRFTGRTAPTAAGFGTPVLFHTDDEGTYLTNTRDTTPTAVQELAGVDDIQRILELGHRHTTQLSARRLDLPAHPPHMLPPNMWMANAPGSTLFMPIGDASEQVLGLLAMALANGNFIVDDEAGRPAGDLAPFVRSGLIDQSKLSPLSVLQQMAYEANIAELSFMAHNIVLTMQAMGLGGLFFNGINRWSVLGAFADDGIAGLGFRFVEDERWTLPNPVGLDGILRGVVPAIPARYADRCPGVRRTQVRPGRHLRPLDTGPMEGCCQDQGWCRSLQRRVRRVLGRGRPVHLRHAWSLSFYLHHDGSHRVCAGCTPRHRVLRHSLPTGRVPGDPQPTLGAMAHRPREQMMGRKSTGLPADYLTRHLLY